MPGVLSSLPKYTGVLPFIFSVDGRKLGPGYEPPTINEIARALGKNCRFAGQCRVFWPVLLHSMVVSDLVAPDIELYALLHDAAEAIFNDTPTPFKPAFFNAREHSVLRDVFESLGVPQPTEDIWKRVKVADLSALSAEAEIVGPRGLAAHLNAGYDTAAEERVVHYLDRFSFEDYLVDGGLAILAFERRVRAAAERLRKAA